MIRTLADPDDVQPCPPWLVEAANANLLEMKRQQWARMNRAEAERKQPETQQAEK